MAAMILSKPSFARIDVAFLKLFDSQGHQIILEKNGEYAHIAISYGKMWLHAHPQRGVELISDQELRKMGEVGEVMTVAQNKELTYAQIKKYLGKPYDREFSWSDNSIYCSELVAKLLHQQPRPMSFDPPYWPPYFARFNGQLGISPDQIHRNLVNSTKMISQKYICGNLF
jgi:hypothetical protein